MLKHCPEFLYGIYFKTYVYIAHLKLYLHLKVYKVDGTHTHTCTCNTRRKASLR